MKVDLNSFDREKAIDEALPVEDVDLELTNARVTQPVRITGTAVKSSSGVVIRGNVTGLIEIECDRCLEPVEQPLDIEFDLEFEPIQRLDGRANLELHASELKVDALDGSEIDIAEIAREQILLDLPQQFFCSEDCKGLCEKCGMNLNVKDCDCENEEIDPRWAALKNLN